MDHIIVRRLSVTLIAVVAVAAPLVLAPDRAGATVNEVAPQERVAASTKTVTQSATASDPLVVPQVPQLGTLSQYLSRTPEENQKIIDSLDSRSRAYIDQELQATQASTAPTLNFETNSSAAISNKRIADQLVFTNTIETFVYSRRTGWQLKFPQFSWSHNGCSSPWFTKPATWAYDAWFNDACIRHDFGYRNYGPRSYLRLAPTETYREKIDDLFYRDMSHKNASVPSANRPALSVAALTFFKMVRWYGASAF